jgi:hypothetical protein
MGQIVSGSIKFKGGLITKEEYQSNACEIEAMIQDEHIRSLVKQGRSIEALRLFVLFEKDFSHSKIYDDLLSLITQVIQRQVAVCQESLNSYAAREQQRANHLERMSQADRLVSERAIKEDEEKIDMYLKAEKESGQRWVSTHSFHKSSLTEFVSHANHELVRLQTQMSKPATMNVCQIYRESYKILKTPMIDANTSRKQINLAKSSKMPKKYIEMLEALIASTPPKGK